MLVSVNIPSLSVSLTMTTSSSADLLESFLHLSLDYTDRLSSADDWTTRSLDDLLSYLKLAKLHDSEAARTMPQTNKESLRISSHSTPLSRPTKTRHYSLDMGSIPELESRVPSVDGAALFKALQPFLDQYITQKDIADDRAVSSKESQEQGKERQEAHERHEANERKEAQERQETQQSQDIPERQELPKKDQNRLDKEDAEKHGKHKPYLPKQAELKKTDFRRQTDMETHAQAFHYDNLDIELHIDDTFDHVRRVASDGTIRYGNSPVTTPPGSSRDSHFTDSRCTVIGRDDTSTDKPFASDTFDAPPQVDLPDLTADEIDLELPPALEDPQETLAQLRLQLEQYKQDNAELVNEVKFLRRAQASKTRDLTERETREHTQRLEHQRPLKTAKETFEADVLTDETSKKQPHNIEEPLTEDNVPEEFRPFYHRLQLDKINSLSDVEKGNIIKNVMLSLLVTDFDHLPSMAPKVGAFLRITARFLDELHARFYECGDMRPLLYLRDYSMDPSDGLEQCLAGMLSKIG